MTTVTPLDAIKYDDAPKIDVGVEWIPVAYNPHLDWDQDGVYTPAEMEQRTRPFLDTTRNPALFNQWIQDHGALPPVCLDEEKYHHRVDNLRSTEDINVIWSYYRQMCDFCWNTSPASCYAVWGLPTQKQLTDEDYRREHPVDGYISTLARNGCVHINCYIQPVNYQWISRVLDAARVVIHGECRRPDLKIVAWLQPVFLTESAPVTDVEWTKMVKACLADGLDVSAVAIWMSYRDEWRSQLTTYLKILRDYTEGAST